MILPCTCTDDFTGDTPLVVASASMTNACPFTLHVAFIDPCSSSALLVSPALRVTIDAADNSAALSASVAATTLERNRCASRQARHESISTNCINAKKKHHKVIAATR